MMNRTPINYSQLSSLAEIKAEKNRLCRAIAKQERTLSKDWHRIEDAWKVFNKVSSMVGNVLSSATMLGGMDIGYRILSHFLSKKKSKIGKTI